MEEIFISNTADLHVTTCNTSNTATSINAPMEVAPEKSNTPTFGNRRRCDMQNMHNETVHLLKEINENLASMNNTMHNISNSFSEQVLVLKQVCAILTKK